MVLSVDDDPINQMVVENLLSPEGYKVEQVSAAARQGAPRCPVYVCMVPCVC